MRTANPVLSDKAFGGFEVVRDDQVMTVQGTVNKSFIAVALTMAAAYWSFGRPEMASMLVPLIIGGLVIALIISFKQSLAPVLTPVYAIAEGMILGTLSLFAEVAYPGIAFQAISLTFGTLACLLMIYKSGLIKVTDKFRFGIAAATGAIFLVYIVNFIMSFFGASITALHSSSPLGIGISVVIVAVAALNLVLDFDFIERTAARGNAPKHMEWFAAFGLLVTLVWLYIEILRLLMKLQSRD